MHLSLVLSVTGPGEVTITVSIAPRSKNSKAFSKVRKT